MNIDIEQLQEIIDSIKIASPEIWDWALQNSQWIGWMDIVIAGILTAIIAIPIIIIKIKELKINDAGIITIAIFVDALMLWPIMDCCIYGVWRLNNPEFAAITDLLRLRGV